MSYHRHDHYHYSQRDYEADKIRGRGAYLGLGGGAIIGGLAWGVPGAILGGITGAVGGLIIGDIVVTFS